MLKYKIPQIVTLIQSTHWKNNQYVLKKKTYV